MLSRIKKIHKMYIVSFFFTLHVALAAYANSTFLASIMPAQYVGIIYTVSAILALILLTRSSSVLEYFGNKKLILILLLINMLSLVGLIVLHSPYVIALSFISLLTTNTLISLCLDIFIEHFGDKATIGKTRGIYLTITNLAWVLSPLLSSFLINYEGGYSAIYLVSFMATIIMTFGLLLSVQTFNDTAYIKTPIIEALKYLKTNRHMFAVSFINFVLQFFFSWMVVYTPIYLIEQIGFGWDSVGIIFTIMLAPFVLFGLPTGLLIDKYHIKKRLLLFIGFSIMILSTASIAFVTTKSVAIWAIILFITRVGASMVETTAEIYFFTHIKEEEAFMLGIFRDMTPVAYIIAPIIATLFLAYLPFNYLFVVLAGILISGIYYTTHLKHNHDPRAETNK